jgi:hypothetical protein
LHGRFSQGNEHPDQGQPGSLHQGVDDDDELPDIGGQRDESLDSHRILMMGWLLNH